MDTTTRTRLNDAIRQIQKGRARGVQLLNDIEDGCTEPRDIMQVGDAWLRAELPDHAVVCFQRAGVTYLDRGFEKHACAMFRMVLDIDPEHPMARTRLADALELQGLIAAADEVRMRCGREAQREEELKPNHGRRWMVPRTSNAFLSAA